MAFIRLDKEVARTTLADLIADYGKQAAALEGPRSGYPEAQARIDYIDKMLRIFGWDVANEAATQHGLRDVVVEQTMSDEGSTGRPDYRLRAAARDRLPWEAKRPSVRLAMNREAAHQARTYGFTLGLPAAVLTNFSELVIFDTTLEPDVAQEADFAVISGCRFAYADYVARFDDLWERLSYESVTSDNFYSVYAYTEPPRGTSPFDRSFLSHFQTWRERLAQSIAAEDPGLQAAEVGRRTQRLLNALLFLRVCEDRNIRKYEDLLKSSQAGLLPDEFRSADQVFNAGLFQTLDQIKVGAGILQSVVRDLYWPQSKFAFGLLQPDTLAALYEQSLAERVEISPTRQVKLVPKPELIHAGGVVPTPALVVERLVNLALDPHVAAGKPAPADLTVIDPACGSGVFLVEALDRLILNEEAAVGRLDLAQRGQLARSHVFGVDIDSEAVEVARLSLLLLVVGQDPVDASTAQAVLPDLSRNVLTGNALVASDFDRIAPVAAGIPERRAAVAPFDWPAAFPAVQAAGGFMCVVGNPPYIRIQTLALYMSDQLRYFKDPRSGYVSGQSHNFDAYMLFIERALRLLRQDGTLAFIVKHGFTSSRAGSGLRGVVGKKLKALIHFGVEQLFPGRLTYTCLIVAGGQDQTVDLDVTLVPDAEAYLADQPPEPTTVSFPRTELGEDVWPMASSGESAVFAAMEAAAVARLEEVVDIFVGVQTSADDIFLVAVVSDDPTKPYIEVRDKEGVRWRLERGVVRPAIRDVRLTPYGDQPVGDYVAIFPYETEQPSPGKKRGKATPFDLSKMQESFPRALAYLQANEKKLRNRAANLGEAFWAYGRNQNTWKVEGPKIINRTISVVPQFVPDLEDHVVPGGGSGPYTLLRPLPGTSLSINVVIALLSHPAADGYVAARARAFHGGYVVHAKATMKNIPIPPLPAAVLLELEQNTIEAQQLERRLRTEQDSVLRSSMIQRRVHLATGNQALITQAYGLTDDEVQAAFG